MTDTAELKQRFWKTLADSPFVFLQHDGAPGTAVPMTAQLDKDANHAIWFFGSRSSDLAKGGPVTATFAGKGHEMFARFSGVLVEEPSSERLEHFWSKPVEAWYPQGKQDPNLILLRMDLGQAELWNSDLGFLDTARMLFGFDMREEAKDEHVETTL
tara:strand:- start:2358 stop:2828 length:471 start_codon:yes stop_codon:yes gene_type:complete